MIYVIVAFVFIIIVVSMLAFMFGKMCRKYKNSYEAERMKFLNLQEEYSKLAEAYRIKKENKEKADEKVSDLHNGTTTADDILPKRKSRV